MATQASDRGLPSSSARKQKGFRREVWVRAGSRASPRPGRSLSPVAQGVRDEFVRISGGSPPSAEIAAMSQECHACGDSGHISWGCPNKGRPGSERCAGTAAETIAPLVTFAASPTTALGAAVVAVAAATAAASGVAAAAMAAATTAAAPSMGAAATATDRGRGRPRSRDRNDDRDRGGGGDRNRRCDSSYDRSDRR